MKPEISRGVTDLEIKDADVDVVQSKPKRHRQWGGALIGLLLGISGLIAGRLGQLYPAFDVFAQFGAQFIFLVFAFAIATFMPRFKGLIGIILAIIFCVVYGAWPIYQSSDVTKGPFPMVNGERAIRVAHFNTYYANKNLEAVTKEVARLDADVVTLIEFDISKKPLLFKLRQQYPFQYDCTDINNCEFAILSKQPILAVSGRGYWKGPPFISARLGGTLTGLTVYGVHTTRFPHSRAQLTQINEFIRHLEGQSGNLLVMGDFNATPFSRITTTLEKGAGLTRLTQLPTWPTTYGLPQLAIDHIFASDGIRVLADQQIGNAAGSDHFPIVMTLAIKPQ